MALTSRGEQIMAEAAAAAEVADLEEELAKLKAKPGDGKKLREVKEQLRELRTVYRLADPDRNGGKAFVIVDGKLRERKEG